MQETTVRILYNVVNIPAGIIKVFTSNLTFKENIIKTKSKESGYNLNQVQAWLRRVCIVHTDLFFFKDPKVTIQPMKPCIVTEKGVLEDSSYFRWSAFFNIKKDLKNSVICGSGQHAAATLGDGFVSQDSTGVELAQEEFSPVPKETFTVPSTAPYEAKLDSGILKDTQNNFSLYESQEKTHIEALMTLMTSY